MAAYGGGNGQTWRDGAADPFTKATGIKVTVSDLPQVDATIRAQAGNPQYNVGWVASMNAITLQKEGVLETFSMDELPNLKNVNPAYILKTPDGRVFGIPVQFQYYGIAYNTTNAKGTDFPSWASLADPKWKGRTAMAQPRDAAGYDLVMYSKMEGGGEKDVTKGMVVMERAIGNVLSVLSSYAQGNVLLSRGEVAALPFYSARVAMLKSQGAAVDMSIPKEGALLLPYVLVVPKGAKDRKELLQFLQYSTSAEPQVRMYDISKYLPFAPDAKLNKEQEAAIGMPLPELVKKLYSPDWAVIADSLRERTAAVEAAQAKK